MNFCGDCKNPNCPEEMPDPNSMACKHFKGKKITNGDVLRQMSNEELADYMSDTDVHACMKDDTRHCNEDWDCHRCWLEWLNSEVEE